MRLTSIWQWCRRFFSPTKEHTVHVRLCSSVRGSQPYWFLKFSLHFNLLLKLPEFLAISNENIRQIFSGPRAPLTVISIASLQATRARNRIIARVGSCALEMAWKMNPPPPYFGSFSTAEAAANVKGLFFVPLRHSGWSCFVLFNPQSIHNVTLCLWGDERLIMYAAFKTCLPGFRKIVGYKVWKTCLPGLRKFVG